MKKFTIKQSAGMMIIETEERVILMKKKIVVFAVLLVLLISNLNSTLKTNKYYADEKNPIRVEDGIGKVNC
jgi:hypothetical protein